MGIHYNFEKKKLTKTKKQNYILIEMKAKFISVIPRKYLFVRDRTKCPRLKFKKKKNRVQDVVKMCLQIIFNVKNQNKKE